MNHVNPVQEILKSRWLVENAATVILPFAHRVAYLFLETRMTAFDETSYADEDPMLKRKGPGNSSGSSSKRDGDGGGGNGRARRGNHSAGAKAGASEKASSSSWVDIAFDDKRVTIACISVWFFICLGGFGWLGIFSSEYMRVGPSPTLTYMGMIIDTMPRYIAVVVFVVLSTAINDFASDAIGPWIQNTVMDHKSQTIPYSKFTIVFIAQSWSLYCGVMTVASIALVFAQFDLIIYRLIIDLFVNQYTMRRFLTNKTHDPLRYHTEFLNEEGDELQPIGVVTEGFNVGNGTDRDSLGTLPYQQRPKLSSEDALAKAIMRSTSAASAAPHHAGSASSYQNDLEYNDSHDMAIYCNETVASMTPTSPAATSAAATSPPLAAGSSSKKKSARHP